MLRLRRSLTFLVLAVATLAAAAHAQTPTGRITGTVRSAVGTALENARVTATNSSTGSSRGATTNEVGVYTISGLVPGSYTVTASLVGHRRFTRQLVQVTGDVTTVDLSLDPLPLQEVVVTATLREQELADVPFSIAAPTASVLRNRGAETLEDVANNVAGLSVQNLGPGQNQVAIRGASAGQIARDQPGVKEQVGAYLDDAPISLSLFTPDLDLFDLSRVEVLRGPQGTLFGSGSVSGTVRYITNQPELGVRSVFGEIGGNVANGGSVGGTVKLGANLPMGEYAAGRIAVYHNQLPGYMDAVQPNLTVNENVNTGSRTGVRAAARYAPTGQFSITPRLVYQNLRANGWNRIDTFNILGNPYTGSRPKVTLGKRRQFTQIPEPYSDDFILGDINARYDLGRVNLTSVSSYAFRDLLVVRDAGALTSSITGGSVGLAEKIYTLNAPLNDATNSKVFTQELRAAGEEGRARWLVGGFFSKNIRNYNQRLLVSGFEAASGIPTKGLRAPKDVLFYSDLAYDLRQTALFGEGTVSATDKLSLTAGLRWYDFNEKRDQVFDGIFGNDDNGTKLVSTPGTTSASGFAPRFIASFKATPELTFNAQAARGFRLGGINDPLNIPLCTAADKVTFSGRDSWKDETVWNYEIGAKSQMMNGRTSLNVALFQMDISDLQLIVTAGSCSSRLVFNVPKAQSRGLEVELAASPNQYVDFSAAGTFTDSKLKSTLTSVDASGKSSVVAGIQSGNRLPSVPQVQGTASVTLRRPMRTGSQGFVTGTVHYVGTHYTQIDDLAAGVGTVDLNSFGVNTIGKPLSQATFTFNPELPAYTLANIRAGVAHASWDAAVFVNNVTDERALLALDRERGLRARIGYLTNQSRTAGVSMTFHY